MATIIDNTLFLSRPSVGDILLLAVTPISSIIRSPGVLPLSVAGQLIAVAASGDRSFTMTVQGVVRGDGSIEGTVSGELL